MAACKKFLQECWSTTIAKGGHDANVLSSLKFVSARPGHLVTVLPVEKRHLNNHKTIHGGVLMSLTDTVTSLTLSTLGIPAPTGVSVNISCEFVRPGGREGDELKGVGEVVKMAPGRSMEAKEMTELQGKENIKLKLNRVVAYGSHTKHMGNNVPQHKFSEDGEEELPMESKAKL